MSKINITLFSSISFVFWFFAGENPASSFGGQHPPGYWDEGYCVSIAGWRYNYKSSVIPIFATCTPMNLRKVRPLAEYQIEQLPISENIDPEYVWIIDLDFHGYY